MCLDMHTLVTPHVVYKRICNDGNDSARSATYEDKNTGGGASLWRYLSNVCEASAPLHMVDSDARRQSATHCSHVGRRIGSERQGHTKGRCDVCTQQRQISYISSNSRSSTIAGKHGHGCCSFNAYEIASGGAVCSPRGRTTPQILA